MRDICHSSRDGDRAFHLDLLVYQSQKVGLERISLSLKALGDSARRAGGALQIKDGLEAAVLVLVTRVIAGASLEALGRGDIVPHEVEMEAGEPRREQKRQEGKDDQDEVDGRGAGGEGLANGGGVVERAAEGIDAEMQRERRGGNDGGLGDGGGHDKGKVRAIVAYADVVAQPRAVVVKPADAVVARGAVAGARRPPDLAGVAEAEGDAAAAEDELALAHGGEGEDGGRERVAARDDAGVGGGGQEGRPGGGDERGDEEEQQRDGHAGVAGEDVREGHAEQRGEYEDG